MKPLWLTMCDAHFVPLLCGHFLYSFDALAMRDDFDLEINHVTGRFGDFPQPDYNAAFFDQMHWVRAKIAGNMGRMIVWSDADIHFYRNPFPVLQECVESSDMAIMMDRMPPDEVFCTALQAFIATPKILRLYDDWIEENLNPRWAYGQQSFNEVLRVDGYLQVAPLDRRFWTIGLEAMDRQPWEDGDRVPAPPDDLILHHGNYTMGLQNKKALLDFICATKSSSPVTAKTLSG